MRSISVILLLCLLHSAYATNYYFSSASGNDSRTALQAQDPTTPWQTLDKLNSIFSSLKAGDQVLLKRGEIFYGSVIIKQSGITIGAYGSGSRPIITSLVTLSGWASKGNGIWESATSLNSTVNMVLLNGAEQQMGRYPNSDAANKGYLNFESHSGKTSITDNDLNTSIDWTGAELVTRPRHWILNRSLITGQSGHKISYTTTSPYEPYDNYGYFIQNSIKTLDKLGEWYYNSSTKKLSVYFGSNDPSSYITQAATTTNDLVSSSGYSNDVLDNLTIKGSNSCGVFINNGSNIHVQNCDILFSGITGAQVHGHTGLVIENCNISNSNNNGIDMEYKVPGAVIKNNNIANTAVIPGLLQNGEGQGLAIYSNGDGVVIENNVLRATGFIGMTFYGNSVTVQNNFVDSFCFVKDDGGGIYTHGGATSNTNRKIIGNIVLNGVGAGPGSDRPTKVSTSAIYIDNNSTDIQVTNNTVSTCFQGIFVQSSTNIMVTNNTSFDNSSQMTIVQRAGDNDVRNDIFTGNNFFSKTSDENTLYIMSSKNDIGSFGTFDYNYYARPADDGLSIFNSWVSGGKTTNQNMNLTTWQSKYGKDAHSKKSPVTVASNIIDQSLRFEYNATSSAKSVSLSGNNYIDVTGKGYSGTLVLQPFTSLILIKTSGSGVVNNAPTVSITSPVANTPFTAPASISITASAADDDGSIAKVDFYAGTTLLGTVSTSPYSFSWNNVAEGNYSLTAVATDNDDLATTSDPVSVSVTNSTDVAPAVSITSPSVNAAFNAPASINITASASAADPGNSIAKVDFYNGTTLIGTVSTSPYSFTWNNVNAGDYSLTAVATDNNGLATKSDAVSISVSGQGSQISPVVNITDPVSGSKYAPASTILLTASATDADGTISTVEFFNGTTLLNTQHTYPYIFTWKNVAAGNYSITAKATDNDGLTTVSSAVLLAVGSPAPTVAITTPGTGATYTESSTITLTAEASEATGTISTVEFFNGSTLLNTQHTYPYIFTWKSVKAGNYSITARATDNNGVATTSAPVKITVYAKKTSTISSAQVSENAPSANSDLLSTSSLNITDLSNIITFRLFPNPSVNTIQISFDGLPSTNKKMDLAILDLKGAVLKRYPFMMPGKKIDVDISSLSAGIYILSLSGDNLKLNKKFVKVN